MKQQKSEKQVLCFFCKKPILDQLVIDYGLLI